MGKYLVYRVASIVPVLLVVSLIVFFLVRLLPGDPAQMMLGADASLEDIQSARVQLGLDRPLPVQYAVWLWSVARGNLGSSIRSGQGVVQSILERLPVTTELALLGVLLAVAVGLPVGILCATSRGSLADTVGTVASLVGVSVPNFFLGVLLMLLFSVHLGWLPPSGYASLVESPAQHIRHMIMPSLVIGGWLAGSVVRQTRSSMLEVLREDYVTTARAKGCTERRVLYKHALKNALVPVVTILGLQTGRLIGGAVITETVFALPGIGRLAVDALYQRDYPVVQGVVLFMAVAVMLSNLVVDITYGYLDPRIRFE